MIGEYKERMKLIKKNKEFRKNLKVGDETQMGTVTEINKEIVTLKVKYHIDNINLPENE